MIGILDYGLGNIRAFSNIYKSFDIQHKLVREKKELDNVDKLIPVSYTHLTLPTIYSV